MLAIETFGLTKRYANGVQALAGADVEVRSGEIFCLLGPNGAGKTTLSRILATQLKPDGGEARVLGHDLLRETGRIRPRLAAVPQQSAPYYALTVREQVFYYLAARGMRRAEARSVTQRLCEQLGLAEKLDQKISTLSGGQRRRVLLCMAMAPPADLLLLDEPTAGLDVLIRREFWRILTQLRQEKTIFLTTHSMEEAEALSERLGIVAEGKLVAVGTPNELRACAPGREKVVIAEGALPRDSIEPLGYLEIYAGRWAIFPRDPEALQRLLNICLAAKIEATVSPASLEDVFIHLVAQRQPIRPGDLK